MMNFDVIPRRYAQVCIEFYAFVLMTNILTPK